MLTESLQWEQAWVDNVMDYFMSSFDHYKRNLSCSSENSFSSASTITITTPVVQIEKGIYSNYMNKKRMLIPTASFVDEYTK